MSRLLTEMNQGEPCFSSLCSVQGTQSSSLGQLFPNAGTCSPRLGWFHGLGGDGERKVASSEQQDETTGNNHFQDIKITRI